MAGDVVYAHPTTVTGSIGVIMKLYDASGLFAKIGLASNPIKSGPNKDIGNPGRPMTPAERAILQHMIDQFYCEFVHVVTERRHLPEERVRELADGRIYTGLEAKELGLVDRIGYLEDAIATAMDLACLKDAKIVAYDRCDGYRGSIYAGLVWARVAPCSCTCGNQARFPDRRKPGRFIAEPLAIVRSDPIDRVWLSSTR